MDLLIGGSGLSPLAFFVLCAVSFLGSFIAAALGLGGGVLVLATMAVVLPPTVLIPVHGVVQLGSNFGRAMLMAKHVLYRFLPAFLIGAVLGAAVGAKVVFALPKWLLLGILGCFVLYATWAPGFKSRKPGHWTFGIVGLLSTFASMFIGGSGPLIAPFVNAAAETRQQVVSTHAMLMTLQHGFKVVAFGIVGFAFGPYLPLLIGLLVFGFIGTWVGKQVLNRLPEQAFRNGLKAVLTILALKLLYDAARAFPGLW
ncbi:MAG: hypothetical protein RLZ98_2745 [Pseudomonadota bacterium]|jgi:uncharacterized membrane protein YfcA